ncbi:hypothetical protein JW752_00755 [Candidatus Peregrinibacteria bacterium]|nr:hypothetical protein [Candidatus Peregrinibacteria bacterium]
MRQVPIPKGEFPRVSQFQPEQPYRRIITPGYEPYRKACEHAKSAALKMMNTEKERGTFDPKTFVKNVWQKSPEYQKADRLWEIYKAEAEAKIRQNDGAEPVKIIRKDIKDILKSVA